MTKHSIDSCKKFAQSKGGKCLSEHYSRSIKLHWECHCSHTWEATWGNIYYNSSWCPKCAGHVLTLEDIENTAKKHGGKCLSDTYINNRTHLKFICQFGHSFSMAPRKVMLGQWCKYCSKNITQEKVRFILQEITQKPWPSTRRVVSPYELDMYSEIDKVAFEYNGRQHYHFIREYHRDQQGFSDQKNRDVIKSKMCKDYEITLNVIPYWVTSTDQCLIDTIKNHLHNSGINFDTKNVNLSYFYKNYSHCVDRLNKVKQFALNKGGECLSALYVNNDTKLEFRCDKEHIWMTAPHAIFSGNWCPKCAYKQRIKTRQKSSCNN